MKGSSLLCATTFRGSCVSEASTIFSKFPFYWFRSRLYTLIVIHVAILVPCSRSSPSVVFTSVEAADSVRMGEKSRGNAKMSQPMRRGIYRRRFTRTCRNFPPQLSLVPRSTSHEPTPRSRPFCSCMRLYSDADIQARDSFPPSECRGMAVRRVSAYQ